MIVVHHLNQSRSQRILWLLEEPGVPYEIAFYERDARDMAPAALRSIHPLGKSPIVTVGDRVVAASGAIIDYIIRRHGNGRLHPNPKDGAYDDYVGHLQSLFEVLVLLTERQSHRPSLAALAGLARCKPSMLGAVECV
jgi:glutathione S-transferase